MNEPDKRTRVYIVEQTVIERYFYTPDEIKTTFADAWGDAEARGESFGDFVIGLFEEHDGSVFHGRFFYNDANPSVGVELVERWDDE